MLIIEPRLATQRGTVARKQFHLSTEYANPRMPTLHRCPLDLQTFAFSPPNLQLPCMALQMHPSGAGYYNAAAAVLPSSAAAVGAVSFLRLLMAFVAGGLFFSTAIAAVGTCYAVGMDNVNRIWELVQLVIRRVWASFAVAVGAAKSTLTGSQTKKWKWRDAWEVLRRQLVETRRTAVEGVEAIRLEANLYAAVVGAPGLIPLQYAVDRLMPLSISAALEQSLRETLAGVKNRNIKKITLSEFTAGSESPQLITARVYDLGADAMAFDCDVNWNSDVQAKINVITAGGMARVPVSIRNVSFNGVVRIILSPLIKEQPGFGALLVSLPSLPKIGLDVRVAGGEITRVPWLRSELMAAIEKGMSEELLWPHRLVIPSMIPTTTSKPRPILSKAELDGLFQSDPLLRAEHAVINTPALRDSVLRAKPDPTLLKSFMNIFVKDDNNKEKNDTAIQ
uniref:SMP-LTD domain-containing protein n=1 Tax=Attheya septentrionalis TaxID=420275 RepID=A0A7S2XNR6_9STRA|mmetsp:Transcript_24110/g.43558  ORF Transcript_24110/g.43558 Transcript_24110/m.43558 type:complete len:451 (+) Transcript_24110:120-1472(+)